MKRHLKFSPAPVRVGAGAPAAAVKKGKGLAEESGEATLGSSIRLGAVAALASALIWSYWPALAGLYRTWDSNPDYSGGKVVPLVAAYLIWSDRKALAGIPVRTCWWGLGVLLFAQVLRMGAVLLSYGSIEQYSILLTVFGTVLLVLGVPATSRMKWVLAFLLLMFPLPRRVHGAIALPLQNWATSSAVFCLELLGVPVSREGNVLTLSNKTTIAVAEACSGLRMLTAFVVVGATLAFVVRRPVWQKAILVFSSIAVAILANTLRLVATALLYEHVGGDVARRFFHDFAGVTMMPVAVGASVGLLYLMHWVTGVSAAPAAVVAPR
jgi:exosortase